MKKLFTFKAFIAIVCIAIIFFLMVISSKLEDINNNLECSDYHDFFRSGSISCIANDIKKDTEEIKNNTERIKYNTNGY